MNEQIKLGFLKYKLEDFQMYDIKAVIMNLKTNISRDKIALKKQSIEDKIYDFITYCYVRNFYYKKNNIDINEEGIFNEFNQLYDIFIQNGGKDEFKGKK